MITAYFKERERYNTNDIREVLNQNLNGHHKLSIEDTNRIVERLKSRGIIKVIKFKKLQDLSDLSIDDLDFTQSYDLGFEKRYVFDFVGIVMLDNIVFKCFPKYIASNENLGDKLKIVVSVLKKYNELYNVREQEFNSMSGLEEKSEFNLLAIIMFILYDFLENGVYTNHKDIITMNGDGDIEWDKTINETYAFVKNNRPLYLDLYTKNSIDDDSDYFRKLHLFIVSECSKILKEAELDKILSLDISFDYEGDKIFDDKEIVLYRISRELNVQFVTRKQLLLKTMYLFISKIKSHEGGYGFSFFGTNNFNIVWEKACGFVLNSQLENRLDTINMLYKEKLADDKHSTLKDLMPIPKWKAASSDSVEHEAKGTLIPDAITMFKQGENRCFYIIDAKYYNILQINKSNSSKYPGVEDVTKQYLYQKAYQNFIKHQGFNKVRNIFLIPGECQETELLGSVSFEIFADLGLEDIKLVKLPSEKIFKAYISGIKKDFMVNLEI